VTVDRDRRLGRIRCQSGIWPQKKIWRECSKIIIIGTEGYNVREEDGVSKKKDLQRIQDNTYPGPSTTPLFYYLARPGSPLSTSFWWPYTFYILSRSSFAANLFSAVCHGRLRLSRLISRYTSDLPPTITCYNLLLECFMKMSSGPMSHDQWISWENGSWDFWWEWLEYP